MIKEQYENMSGEICVIVDNPDGTYWSGLKSTYEAMQAEQSTPSLKNGTIS
jgi:hypothetical protein